MPIIALLSWPFISLFAFAKARPSATLLFAIFVPYLLLPEGLVIYLSGVPDLDKTSVITLGLVFLVLFQSGKFASIKPRAGFTSEGKFLFFLLISLFLMMIVGVVLTMATNGEPIRFIGKTLPGMGLSDVITRLSAVFFFAFPFFVGQRYFGTQVGHREILLFLAVSCLFYSLLMLFEVRFSPQLHRLVYGYHQHSFAQHVRDGYRPKVFLEHGLHVGLFLFMSVVACAALWRTTNNKNWLFAAIWLFIMLIVSRNLGATIIATLILPIFLFASRWMQLAFMMVLSGVIVLYPVLRGTQVVPIERIVEVAASISQDRADSLQYRLGNEEVIIERNNLKPAFGWGNWSRGRVHDENGRDLTVVEGWWIQTIMEWGWVGYVSLFGIVVAPVFMLYFIRKRRDISVETVAIGLILCGNFIDFIPNSAFTPISWLLVGSLAGYIFRSSTGAQETQAPDNALQRHVSYSRFPSPAASKT